MKYFIGISIALWLSSCSKSILPEAPDANIAALPALERPDSEINIPIKINLSPYFRAADKDLPKTFKGSEEHCSGLSFSYRFEREPIQFAGKGSKLIYDISGKYALKLNYCPECTSLLDDKGTCLIPRVYASCGVNEPMRKIDIGYSTELFLDQNYRFQSTTSLRKAEAVDECRVTFLSYDATEKVLVEMKKEFKRLEKEIDQQIENINIKNSIEEVWKQLASPMAIGKYGFLNLKRSGISVSKINFYKEEAYINLKLKASPEINAIADGSTSTSLPKLEDYQQSSGFQIFLDVKAPYDSMSNILTNEFKGKEIVLQKNKIFIDSLKIKSSQDAFLHFEVAFSGDKKGLFYLAGKPSFDTLTQELSFPNLSFDIKSKNLLLKSAKWLFSDKITHMIQEKARIDLKPHFEILIAMVEKEMNQEIKKGVKMNGSLDAMEVKGIYPLRDELVVRVKSIGQLAIKL